MNSLFTKIFLWFLLMVIVTSTASFYISQNFYRSRQPQFNRMPLELREARQAWEAEGAPGLTRFLARFKDAMGADGFLTDGAGRDVLSGHDWSADIRLAGQNGQGGRGGPFPFFVRIERERRGWYVSPTLARDKKYYFIAVFPAREPAQKGWSIEVPTQTWWGLGIFALLCYLLARHLTSPLRRMQKTVERFGRGDFSARVNSRRRDEFGQLGRTVDQMADRIDLLLKSQRRLLQDISHELRSPLARLGVAVELARGGGDAATGFNRVEREADRLNTLVGELIQVTRAEGDPDGIYTEQVQLDDLVRVILDDVHIEADRRQVTLNSRIEPVELDGNPELLRRAIENIVRNAIRYSPEGTEVDVTQSHIPTGFRIAVRHHGSGVPADSLPSIFDPFYRVEKDRGRTSGGVGLGLAIAKRAVELHHGSMRAENVQPGLKVEIDLPAPERHSLAIQHEDSTLTPAFKK
ncbi:MAG: ATP-binding protein [Acidobacteriota bacterium]|nr:ATP-binding protein [Acidobacteriota bacterium]